MFYISEISECVCVHTCIYSARLESERAWCSLTKKKEATAVTTASYHLLSFLNPPPSTAGAVSYTWVARVCGLFITNRSARARSRSKSTSQFTALALNKPSSSSSSFTALALNKLSPSSSSNSSTRARHGQRRRHDGVVGGAAAAGVRGARPGRGLHLFP